MSWSQEARAKIIAGSYQVWGLNCKKVLDIGCGNCVVSQVLKEKLNLELTATDIMDYHKKNIPFRQMEGSLKLPFEDASFDYAMFNCVLHHARDIETLILEGSRVARNLLVFEDKPGCLIKVVDKALNYLYCPKMPPAINFKSQIEWIKLFERTGFDYEIGNIEYPFWYPFKHMAFKLVSKNNTVSGRLRG